MALRESYRLFSDLKFGLQEETIKARIARVWDGMSYRTSDEVASYFILLDEEDNQSLAIAPAGERTRLLAELHEIMVYYITNFKIVVGPSKWNPVPTERAIIFGQQTETRLCYDASSISRFKFELCPIPSLSPRLGNIDNLIDVSGILFNVGNIKHKKHGVQKLDIQLMDESGGVVTISLWGIRTTQFDIKLEIHRKKNLVLVITGLVVKSSNGQIYLASTLATKFYFSPEYKQLAKLGNKVALNYGEYICRLPYTEAYEHLHPISVKRKHLTLQQIKDHRTWVQAKVQDNQLFFCKVTIKDILSSENWYFKPVPEDDTLLSAETTYHCLTCRKTFIPVIKSSKTVILVLDSTTTAKLIMKPRELEQLTGLSMLQLMTRCVDNHAKYDDSLPSEISHMRNSLCTFQVETPINTEAGDIAEIMIKAIVESTKLVVKRKPQLYLTQSVEKKPCPL